MKNLIQLSLVITLFVAGTSIFAQNNCKCGFIDRQKLLEQMPEVDVAKKILEKERKDIQEALETLQVAYNKNLQVYLDNEKLETGNNAKWTKDVIQNKEYELQSLQSRIQEIKNNATEKLQQKLSELNEPILKKLDDAIKKAAADGNYMTVYDTSAILYVSPSLCTDITPAVKTLLGIK